MCCAGSRGLKERSCWLDGPQQPTTANECFPSPCWSQEQGNSALILTAACDEVWFPRDTVSRSGGGSVTWARKCGGSCDECHACHEPRSRSLSEAGSALALTSVVTRVSLLSVTSVGTLPRHVVTGPPLGAGPGPSLSALILVTSVCAVLLSSPPSTQVQVKLYELYVMLLKC